MSFYFKIEEIKYLLLMNDNELILSERIKKRSFWKYLFYSHTLRVVCLNTFSISQTIQHYFSSKISVWLEKWISMKEDEFWYCMIEIYLNYLKTNLNHPPPSRRDIHAKLRECWLHAERDDKKQNNLKRQRKRQKV